MGWCNSMKDFIDYAFNGVIVGRTVNMVERLYPIYCKLFKVEEVNNIVNRICNKYDLFIVKGVFKK